MRFSNLLKSRHSREVHARNRTHRCQLALKPFTEQLENRALLSISPIVSITPPSGTGVYGGLTDIKANISPSTPIGQQVKFIKLDDNGGQGIDLGTVQTDANGIADLQSPYAFDLNAGTYSIEADLYADGNIVGTATGNLKIAPADATVVITPYSGTYDASPHGFSGYCYGVSIHGTHYGLGQLLNIDYSTYTDVGTHSITWTFNGPASNSNPHDPNYTTLSGNTSIVITPATAVISVNGWNGVYDSQAHGASGHATGVGTPSENLDSLLHVSTTTYVNAGSNAGVDWTFHDPNGNYLDETGTASVNITQANATVVVTPFSGTYDASSHSAGFYAYGVNNNGLGNLMNIGASFTDAGNHSTTWTFNDPTSTSNPYNSNYTTLSGTISIDITQADAHIVVNGFTGTYDGQTHGANGYAIGVHDRNLSNLLNTGDAYTNAGCYTPMWKFSGGNNYKTMTGTTQINIAQADAHIVVNGFTGTYDGQTHGANGYAIGVCGENLNSALNTGAAYVNAGTYTDTWTFAGNVNYKAATSKVCVTINPLTIGVNIATQQTLCISAARNITFTINLGKASPQYASLFNNAPVTVAVNGTSYTTTAIAHVVRSGGRNPTYKVTLNVIMTSNLRAALLPTTAASHGRLQNVFTVKSRLNGGNHAFVSSVATRLQAGKQLLNHFRRWGW